MRNSVRLPACAAMLLFILSAAACHGQIIYGDPMRGEAALIYQGWKLTYSDDVAEPETTLTQTAFPAYFFLPVAEDWEIHINAAFSRSHADGGDEGNSVSSLSTPLVRAYRSFSDDRLFLSAGLALPGGKRELDTAELPIAELISGDYLILPVKQLGNGVGLFLQGGGAQQYEQLLFGGSVSYFLVGSYTYAEGGGDYNPGDEFTLQGSATLPLNQGRLDLDLGYKYFVADQLDSKDIFKNGDQFSVGISGGYDFGQTYGAFNFLYLIRGKDSRRSGESFAYEENNSNGNKTVISGSVKQRISESVTGTFLASYRLVGANDWEEDNPSFFGDSDLFSVGAQVGYASGDDRYSLFGKIMLHNGAANDDAISISGTEIAVGGRVRL